FRLTQRLNKSQEIHEESTGRTWAMAEIGTRRKRTVQEPLREPTRQPVRRLVPNKEKPRRKESAPA
ncbi:MAG: hypothetical protein ACRDTR_01635, partial [Rubrobacter sp.]